MRYLLPLLLALSFASNSFGMDGRAFKRLTGKVKAAASKIVKCRSCK